MNIFYCRLFCALRLGVELAEGVNGYTFQNLRPQGLIAHIRIGCGNFIDGFHSFDHLAESGILPVQMRGILVHNKKL